MSLNVNAETLSIGQADADQVSSVWDTLDEVMTVAMKEGFFPMNKPHFDIPDLHPNDLANTTPDSYAVLFTQLETWNDYVTSALAGIDGYILQCDNELDILSTDIKTTMRKAASDAKDKKPSEEILKDAVKSNPRYREVLHAKQVTQQKKLIVEAVGKRVARSLRTLSRYIEVRKEKLGQGSRRTAF